MLRLLLVSRTSLAMSVVLTVEQVFSYRTKDRMQACWTRLDGAKEANHSFGRPDFFRRRG